MGLRVEEVNRIKDKITKRQQQTFNSNDNVSPNSGKLPHSYPSFIPLPPPLLYNVDQYYNYLLYQTVEVNIELETW